MRCVARARAVMRANVAHLPPPLGHLPPVQDVTLTLNPDPNHDPLTLIY